MKHRVGCHCNYIENRRERERECVCERVHLKGRVGERSRANCVLDSINEGESAGKHSFPFPRSARASFTKLVGFLSILQQVHEQNTAVWFPSDKNGAEQE